MTLLEKLKKDEKFDRAFASEYLSVCMTEELLKWMEEHKVTITTVAVRLGKSKGFVSSLLDGKRKMTLKNLSDLLWASGAELDFSIKIRK